MAKGSKGTLTVEQARQMGRDRMPLRLHAKGRTLVLCKSLNGERLSVHIEAGEQSNTVALVCAKERPAVDGLYLDCARATFVLDRGESAVIDAWLDGYYGVGGAA